MFPIPSARWQHPTSEALVNKVPIHPLSKSSPDTILAANRSMLGNSGQFFPTPERSNPIFDLTYLDIW